MSEISTKYAKTIQASTVINKIVGVCRSPKNRIDETTETAVVACAIAFPNFGQVRASNELRKWGVFASPSAVRCVWLRHNLATSKQRLAALELEAAKTGFVLTEAQVVALERKRADDVACGEIETVHPGYLGTQDTFYVVTLNGVGRIYQQTFVDTHSKWAAAKLYTSKTPITAANLLNGRVLPFFKEGGLELLRILTDRGSEFCGKAEVHDYARYLAINNIEHIKIQHSQTNGICDRFHKTLFQEFYQVALRTKIYSGIDDLQRDLDAWINRYNAERMHEGKICCGRTPVTTTLSDKEFWNEEVIGNPHVDVTRPLPCLNRR